ncbi:MAG: HPF/RaiA family ribosome-associated protein [Bdellovibrionota bacterium]
MASTYVEGSSKDMYESVDLLVSKLEGQFEKEKKRNLKNHKFRDRILGKTKTLAIIRVGGFRCSSIFEDAK